MWGRIFADHVAGAIANARAFEEIQRLKAQLEQQNAYLQEEVVEAKAFGDLVGQSAALRQIVSQIDLVAPTEASVLILGETGTGKELVAHEIHRRSRRKDKPLIRVNCASIPKELYESEFFGHAKGAFTGAIKDRAGRFEAAEGGTLFLDEIGEVPVDLQGKLLRALQDKVTSAWAKTARGTADVRIIAATNRDLKKEAAAGRFREDLYYRLNVFPDPGRPAARAQGGHSPAGATFHQTVREGTGLSQTAIDARGNRPTSKLRLARQHPGIAERDRTRRHSGAGRRTGVRFAGQRCPARPRVRTRHPKMDNAAEREFLTELEMQRRERENLLAGPRKEPAGKSKVRTAPRNFWA